MDECVSFDVPGILIRLAELEEIAFRRPAKTTRGLESQLMAVQVAHKLLIDRLVADSTSENCRRGTAFGSRHCPPSGRAGALGLTLGELINGQKLVRPQAQR